MKSLRILIADDEYFAREIIKTYLKDRPEIETVSEATTGQETLDQIYEIRPHLLFLDIQMPVINGIDILSRLDSSVRPVVIFTTAFADYALKAFEVNAIDYLLKPFDKPRFETALAKGLDHIKSKDYSLDKVVKQLQDSYNALQQTSIPEHLTRIMVKEPKKMFFVKTEDVYWFEASGDYVVVHLEKKSHLISQSLNQLETHLSSNDFVRIHRSYIINVHYIAQFEPYFNSEYFITLKNNTRLKLSRSYRDRLRFLFADLFDK